MRSFDLSSITCSRRSFVTGAATITATTAVGALLAACGDETVAGRVSQASIPVGRGVIVEAWIIAQPEEGVYTAFSTVCPHARGAIDHFEDVNGETVAVCSKHESAFSLTDGSVVSGPSRDPMTRASSVEVSDGEVIAS